MNNDIPGATRVLIGEQCRNEHAGCRNWSTPELNRFENDTEAAQEGPFYSVESNKEKEEEKKNPTCLNLYPIT